MPMKTCPFKSCGLEGLKLKRHLTGKFHKLNEIDAALRESYLRHKVKYICCLFKHGVPVPTICSICKICVERIDQHQTYVHQVRRGTTEMQNKIKRSKAFTMQFQTDFLKNTLDSGDNESQEVEPDKDKSDNETSNIEFIHKSKKMPQTKGTHQTRLRAVYVPLTPSKYKKPLTGELKKKLGINSFGFKHHYPVERNFYWILRDIQQSIASKKQKVQANIHQMSNKFGWL